MSTMVRFMMTCVFGLHMMTAVLAVVRGLAGCLSMIVQRVLLSLMRISVVYSIATHKRQRQRDLAEGRVGHFAYMRPDAVSPELCYDIYRFQDRIYAVDTSMWFLACGSKVHDVLRLSFFALRAKNDNHTDGSYRSAEG